MIAVGLVGEVVGAQELARTYGQAFRPPDWPGQRGLKTSQKV